MKRCFLWLFVCVAFSLTGVAQQTMRSLFIAMPDSVLPLLTKVNREDCVDFLESNMKAVVTNRLDGQTVLDRLTDDYFYLTYTSQSTVEVKRLPLNDSVSVLCMARTVGAKVCDSEVLFFDEQWKPLNTADYLTLPLLEDYAVKPLTDSAQVFFQKLDMRLQKVTLFPAEVTLDCSLSSVDLLNEEDRKEVAGYLKQEALQFRWEKGRFVPQFKLEIQ